MRRIFPAALAGLLVSCSGPSAMQRGDAAAALDDYPQAVEQYSIAVRDDPGSTAAVQKLVAIKARARAAALRRGKECQAKEDWDCALANADEALRYGDDDAEALALKREASDFAALVHRAQAIQAAKEKQFARAFAEMDRALQIAYEADQRAEMRKQQALIADQGTAEAEVLCAARAYRDEIALLELVVKVDPSRAPLLEGARADLDRELAIEAEAIAAEGDAKLAAGSFADAAERYNAAVQKHAGGRAVRLAALATAAAEADAAEARRDWPVALRRIQDALGAEPDERVAARLRDREGAFAASAASDGEKLAAEHDYDHALELISAAARANPSYGARVEAVQEQRAQWTEERAEAAAREGDAALAAHRWDDAERSYNASLALRPGGRAAGLAAYARELSAAERARASRDFNGAASHYQAAAASGHDAGNYAAQALVAVRQEQSAATPPPPRPHGPVPRTFRLAHVDANAPHGNHGWLARGQVAPKRPWVELRLAGRTLWKSARAEQGELSVGADVQFQLAPHDTLEVVLLDGDENSPRTLAHARQQGRSLGNVLQASGSGGSSVRAQLDQR